jgi:hypothetical protein
MGGVINNAKRHTDYFRHPPPGPPLAAEAIGLGATVQQIGPACQLGRRQSAGCTGRWARAEDLRAALSSLFQPLADGSGADPQSLGYLVLRPALLQEMPGWQASRFFPVVSSRVHASHDSTCQWLVKEFMLCSVGSNKVLLCWNHHSVERY